MTRLAMHMRLLKPLLYDSRSLYLINARYVLMSEAAADELFTANYPLSSLLSFGADDGAFARGVSQLRPYRPCE